MIKNLIFDLDGTLLHSLPDIVSAVNDALSACGYSYSFTVEEGKSLIGNGAETLMRRALKEDGQNEAKFKAFQAEYMPRYKEYQQRTTAPFGGIKEDIHLLKESGVRLFVITNKPDHLAKIIVPKWFGDSFEAVRGHQEGEPVKPDPFAVNDLLARFSLNSQETLYIGDSEVDVDTAHNAGLKAGLVTWGYGRYTKALFRKADYRFNHPSEFHRFIRA